VKHQDPEPLVADCASVFDAPEPAVGNYFVSTYPPMLPAFYRPEHRAARYS
jgi:hypothetical protein